MSKAKRNQAKKREYHEMLQTLCVSERFVSQLAELEPKDVLNHGSSASVQSIVKQASIISSAVSTLPALVNVGHATARERADSNALRVYSALERTLNHAQERRNLARRLGLLGSSYSVEEAVAQSQEYISTRASAIPIRLVERSRRADEDTDGHPRIRRYDYMKEASFEFTNRNRPSVTVNPDTGFRVVSPEESVVYFSRDADGSCNIELVVIRGVMAGHDISDEFFTWLKDVIEVACRERRDVRPTHEGKMAQAGLNMGPRSCRILGWARSYIKKLDETTRIIHDTEVIAAASLIWNIARNAAPCEVAGHVDLAMNSISTDSNADFPRLATRDVPSGTGYTLVLDGKEFHFEAAERAPPEVYMTKGYVAWAHTDSAYCDYAYSFCADRTVSPPESGNTTGPSQSWIPGGGANFVDVSLRVVVKQAKGTLIVFKPEKLHGTTLACGAINHAITIAFSQRIANAWGGATDVQQEEIVSQIRVGEGNPDIPAAQSARTSHRTDVDEEFEVDHIADSKKMDGVWWYYVYWKGYSAGTWEPQKNVDDCIALDNWLHMHPDDQ